MTLAELLCAAYVALALPNSQVMCKNADTVVESTYKHNVSAPIMTALIFYESRWTPSAVSGSNACGLTQVLPKYTRMPRLTCEELLEPKTSIEAGSKALGKWLRGYGRGKYKIALCGYSKGYRCRGENPHEGAMRYARRVIKLSKRIKRKMMVLKERHHRGYDVSLGVTGE
jgi:soluble lytic murein transglycosylase-like protein